MTNPTRTRAEIHAEIEKLKQELAAMPEREWKVGDRVACIGTVKEILRWAKVEFDNNIGSPLIDYPALIPAADLIPRAEHEAAVAEAKKITLTDAIMKLVQWHKDNPNDQFDVVSDFSGLYRVTVELVPQQGSVKEAFQALAEATKGALEGYIPEVDGPVKCLKQPADANPVGWVADRGEAGLSSVLLDSEGQATRFNDGGPAVPLYRRPFDPVRILECAEGMSAYRHGSEGFVAYRKRLCGLLGVDAGTDFDSMNLTPMPRAVAPVGVVEELKAAVQRVVFEARCCHPDEKPSREYIKADKDYRTVISKITELPPPSEFAKQLASEIFMRSDLRGDLIPQIAAALMEQEVES